MRKLIYKSERPYTEDINDLIEKGGAGSGKAGHKTVHQDELLHIEHVKVHSPSHHEYKVHAAGESWSHHYDTKTRQHKTSGETPVGSDWDPVHSQTRDHVRKHAVKQELSTMSSAEKNQRMHDLESHIDSMDKKSGRGKYSPGT